MQPVTRTPPVPDIPRCKLKQIARWIRDDLDILVAREGPNVLQPDDVVFLHELFVALSQSITITIGDLRATGIHKAVKDIAGVATRWPGRLCDDCDKIIVLWTSKFGRLDDLHPFLCGRGGRLEGIASVTEYTRQALLKRWTEHCPEKIHPSASHRQGDLGFRAGDWWINSLFAHHAGIIGLESLEGGTTYNKNAAYALVLKDTGEIEATSEDFFTYRFPLNDKGKFRLTAATPASRQPIRVLRCHSINSIWGPKAGIRYEGLYAVKGWCVRLATLKDIFSGEGKIGDVLYEVTMQRTDPVSMEEVSKRPTNMEVDDYAEYKRLRKRHREHKRGAPGQVLMPQQPFKAAPPILPLQVSGSSIMATQSTLRASPSVSRKAAFKESVFDAPKASQEPNRPPTADIVSPMTSPDRQESFFVMETSAAPAMPATGDKDKPSPSTSFETVPHQKEAQILSSITSSVRSGQSDLKVILPWIDLETDSPLPAPSDAPPVITKEVPSQATNGLEAQAAEMNPVKKVRRLARDPRRPSDTILQSQEARKKSTATNPHSLRFYPARPILGGKEEEKWETRRDKLFKKTLFGKKPKFFDGAGYNADEADCESIPSHACTPYIRSSSSDNAIQLHSPPSARPPIPGYLLADLTPSHGVEDIEFASPLENLITMTTASSCIVPPVVPRGRRNSVVGSVVGSLRRMASRLS